MKEFKIDKTYCMGAWFMPEKICDDLIKFFHLNNENIHEGETLLGIRKDIKDSRDLQIKPLYQHDLIIPYRIKLQKCLEKYVKKYPVVGSLDKFDIIEDYRIQHYKKNGGYKDWHCERTGNRTGSRTLVFMTYLNTVKDGGTIFKYQNMTIPCIKGLTLIWPTDFTHLHKGQISKLQEKYIITGWYNFV